MGSESVSKHVIYGLTTEKNTTQRQSPLEPLVHYEEATLLLLVESQCQFILS